MTLPHDPFFRVELPPCASRERRVELLLAAGRALAAGQQVPPIAAQYLGRALVAWLALGGSLEREHLRVAAAAGSHRTPAYIAARLATGMPVDADDVGAASSEGATEGPDMSTMHTSATQTGDRAET